MVVVTKNGAAPRSPPPAWKTVLGCTAESLALFRIVLGSLLTLELLLRFRFLHPFYSDEGTLPLRLLMSKVDDIYKILCLHCRFGLVLHQQVILAVQVLIALLFTAGIQTRLTAALSWYLYFSLTLRNTWMNYILDRYFHYLMFLAMFLPLDRVWTLSKKSKNKQQVDRSLVVSSATIALKALVVWIYIDAGGGKYLDPDGGWTYSARIPALDTYARHTLVARYLYALIGPDGLRFLTPIVVWVELLAAPVALFGSLIQSRAMVNVAVSLIISLHVGIALTLRNAALLSFVACAAWIPFLPIGWERAESLTRPKTSGLLSVPLVLIGLLVTGNIWFEMYSQSCDQSVKHVWSTLLHNRWNVFVGAEEYVTWEIAPGELVDGSFVDVWGRRDEINWSLPGGGAPCTATARPGRWRSFPYLAELDGEDGEVLWQYLCDEWDRENNVEQNPGRKLVRFNFFMLQADVLPNMAFSPTRKRLIKSFECIPQSNATTFGQDAEKELLGMEGTKERKEEL